jgi:hypothetical protein
VAQVVECLLCKHEALSSNHSLTKKKRKEKENVMELSVVMHTCNSSTQEAEAGGLRVPGQPGLHSETLAK